MKKKLFNKERIIDGLNSVWDITKAGLKIVIPIVVTGYTNNMVKKQSDCGVEYYGEPDYGDAIKAITTSRMFSGDIAEAVKEVRREMTSDYYSAVISIARSKMFSGDKVQSIKKLNN